MSRITSFLHSRSRPLSRTRLELHYDPTIDHAAIRRRKEYIRRATAALCCCILAFTVLYLIAASMRSATVLVASSSIPAGHRITSKDIRAVRVSASQLTDTLLSSSQEALNYFTKIDLSQGDPISAAVITKEPLTPIGQTIVSFEPSSMPTALQIGDSVQILSTNCTTTPSSATQEDAQDGDIAAQTMQDAQAPQNTKTTKFMQTTQTTQTIQTIQTTQIAENQSCTIVDKAIVHQVHYAEDSEATKQSSGLLNAPTEQTHHMLRIAVNADQALALVDAQTRGSSIIVVRAN